ncbi:MAG: hypothetical protein HY646_03710 [Acidobacteria bacterium]|nr:hypothetical protein [Acidobacteriota bacterium]
MWRIVFVTEIKRAFYRGLLLLGICLVLGWLLARVVFPFFGPVSSSDDQAAAKEIFDVLSILVVSMSGIYAGGLAFSSVSEGKATFLFALPIDRFRLWIALTGANAAGTGMPGLTLLLLRLPVTLSGWDNLEFLLVGFTCYCIFYSVTASTSLLLSRTIFAVGFTFIALLLYGLPFAVWDLYLGRVPDAVGNWITWSVLGYVILLHLALSLVFFLRSETSDARILVRNLSIVALCIVFLPVATYFVIEFELLASADGFRMSSRPEFSVSPDGKYAVVLERFRGQRAFGRMHVLDLPSGRLVKTEPFKGTGPPLWSSNPAGIITGASGSVFEFLAYAISISEPSTSRLVRNRNRQLERLQPLLDFLASPWAGRQTVELHAVADTPRSRMRIPTPMAVASRPDRILLIAGKRGSLELMQVDHSGIRALTPPIAAENGGFDFVGDDVLATFDVETSLRMWLAGKSVTELVWQSEDRSAKSLPWLLFDSKVYPANEEAIRRIDERVPAEIPKGWFRAFARMPVLHLEQWDSRFSNAVSLDHGATLFCVHFNPRTKMAKLLAWNSQMDRWKEFDEMSWPEFELRRNLDRSASPAVYFRGSARFQSDFDAGVAVYFKIESGQARAFLYDARRDRRIELVSVPAGEKQDRSGIETVRVNGLAGLYIGVYSGRNSRDYVYDTATGELSMLKTLPSRRFGRRLYLNLRGERVVEQNDGSRLLFITPDGAERQLWPLPSN